MDKELLSQLVELYGQETGRSAYARLELLLEKYRTAFAGRRKWTPGHADVILITYADQVQEPGEPSLKTLVRFLEKYCNQIVSILHILPFHPWSSDDGFSVKDYRIIDPRYGDWGDIDRLGSNFRMMIDAVINHTSVENNWFQHFLRGDPKYKDYYITVEGNPDLSKVVRPRNLPLTTKFMTTEGEKSIWTTFSADQVDLNYQNPEVLLEVLELLLYYLSKGAGLFRLDAVAYLWKEPGTTCIHLPQTYRIVQFIRSVLDRYAPDVHLITETNVPHKENISYFGDGQNKAHLVYNFTLPPLLLHTFHTGSCMAFNAWLHANPSPSNRVTFLNFLASHDGIGVNPLRDVIEEIDIDRLVEKVQLRGGRISYKNVGAGNQVPYELNINYFDALNDPNGQESEEMQVNRFVTAHAILLSLRGIPCIYFHSLFGSHGWLEGVELTGQNRSINRQKLAVKDIITELEHQHSQRTKIFNGISRLIEARASSVAFDPYGKQQVIEFQPQIFAILRYSEHHAKRVICVHNITAQMQSFKVADGLFEAERNTVVDMLTNSTYKVKDLDVIHLAPYQSIWLT